jgi:hypothetical protein
MNVKGKIRFELESPVAYEMFININSISSAINATALIQHQISLLKSIEEAENRPREVNSAPQQYIDEPDHEILD